MKRLIPYFRGYWKEFCLGPIFKLLEAIFELIVPLVMAKMIDVGITNRDTHYILKMGGVLVLLAVCGLIFALICQYFAAKCAYGFGTQLRNALYHHINTLSHRELDHLGTASLITRLNTDSNTLQSGVNMFIRLGTRAPFLIIGAAVMSIRIDLKLSLIFFIVVPLISYILYRVMHYTIPHYESNQGQLDVVARRTRENLDGVRVIRAFSRQKQESQAYAQACGELSEQVIAVGRVSALLNPISFLIMNLGIVAVLWFGGFQVHTGSLTQGEVTAFVNYMTQIALALVRAAELMVSLTKAEASAKRISKVLEIQPDLVGGTDTLQQDHSTAAVVFDNVTFSYPNAGAPAVSQISFDLQPGQTLGIIGGTGSGKSTVAALIPRFYDPQEGTVSLYGKQVDCYDLQALRQAVGIVPQRATLVSGTIADNLRWAKQDATEEELITALKIAQAWEFVQQLPDQLETTVAQGGKNFSGGQRQRLTIARALVGSPDLLILDDSMSALDYATDLALRQALERELPHTTKIIISQRAPSLQHADHILVMEDGVCVGAGTHAQLLESCSVYAEIYASQMAN